MNLRRQILLVSLLTLILPWAGCQFIRETESALREGQQQMLGGTAKAIADSLSQFPYEMLPDDGVDTHVYAHPLITAPLIDGYSDDWTIPEGAINIMRGTDGPIHYVLGQHRQNWYVYVEVRDSAVVYTDATTVGNRGVNADAVTLISVDGNDDQTSFRFAAEAPGKIIATRHNGNLSLDEPRIDAGDLVHLLRRGPRSERIHHRQQSSVEALVDLVQEGVLVQLDVPVVPVERRILALE